MCPSVTWQWRTQPRPSSQLKCGQTPRQTGNSQDSEGTLSGMDPTQMGTPALGEGGGMDDASFVPYLQGFSGWLTIEL